MKSPNSTDRFFSERLGEYDSGAPMHLWDAIDQKRSWQHRVWTRVKRNSWLLLLLFISGAGVGIFTILQNENTTLANGDIENLDAFRIDLIGSTKIAGTLEVPTISEVSSEANNSLNEKISQNNTSKNNSNSSSNLNRKAKYQEKSNTKAPKTLSEVTQSNHIIHQNSDDSKVTTSFSLNNQIDLKETNIYSNSTDPVALESNLRGQNSVAAISNLDLNLLEVADDRDLPDPCFAFNKKDKKQKKIKKRTGPPTFYVDAVLSPDYANRKLTLQSGSDQQNYLNEREASEKFRFAYSGGLRLSIVSRSGFALRTGLMYAQINERFDYENGNETEIISEPIYDNGVLIGYDTSIVHGTLIKTTFNRFHLIDIPAILGYELEFRRFVYSVNAGIYFNLFFKKRGEILNENLYPQSFSSNNENALPAFRKKLGMSYFGSFGIHYKWKENIQILIEPHVRYYPDSFTKSDYSVKQNYWTAGVLMGMRYKF